MYNQAFVSDPFWLVFRHQYHYISGFEIWYWVTVPKVRINIAYQGLYCLNKNSINRIFRQNIEIVLAPYCLIEWAPLLNPSTSWKRVSYGQYGLYYKLPIFLHSCSTVPPMVWRTATGECLLSEHTKRRIKAMNKHGTIVNINIRMNNKKDELFLPEHVNSCIFIPAPPPSPLLLTILHISFSCLSSSEHFVVILCH